MTEEVKISDEMIEEATSRVGQEVKTREIPFLTEATKDSIRHYAYGIGDLNPLWSDEEYASKSVYGCLVAPPTIVDAFTKLVDRGFPGIHGFFTGTNYEWHHPIRVNDKITSKMFFGDVVEKRSSFAGRAFIQYYNAQFRNQANQLVATAQYHIMRFERAGSERGDKYKGTTQQSYTEEQIKAIFDDYDREIIRGAEPLYWENVEVGDELPAVVKGPLTTTDVIAWNIGVGGVYVKAHKHMVEYLKRHPAMGVPNDLGIPDIPERVHWDSEFARKVGSPGPYDYGPERIAWLGCLMTNWIGDNGFLRKLSVQLRRLNLIGDTTRCRGKVLRKDVLDGEHLVECEVWCENQKGEKTASGTAVAKLPSPSKPLKLR